MKILLLVSVLFILGSSCKKDDPVPNIHVDSLNSGVKYHLYSINFANDNVGYVGGYKGSVLKTINAGSSWTLVRDTLYSQIIIGVYFTDASTGIVLENGYNDSSGVYITENGGASWSSASSATKTSVYNEYKSKKPYPGFYMLNDTLGFAVKNTSGTNLAAGKIFKITGLDYENDYSVIDVEIHYNFNDVHFVNTSNGFIVGANTLMETTDGGVTWSWLRNQEGLNVSYNGNNTIYHGVYCLNGDRGIAVGENGAIITFYR